MLNRIFDLDNPVMRALTALFDLLILNLITLVLCIPVVTAVPALTALHYMTLKMARGEMTYLFQPYFKSFAQNFKQSFIIGLIYIAAGVVLYMDWQLVYGNENLFPQAMRILVTAVIIIVVLLFLWVIPLQAHFENPIRVTFRNSVFMSIGNFPRSLAILGIWIVPVLLCLASYAVWPIVFMFGLSGPAFCAAKVYSPVFQRFEPEPEEETPDMLFSMDEADLEQFSKDLNATFGDEENPQN